MIARYRTVGAVLMASCVATPAFALTPEQETAMDRAYSFLERAAECADTVRKPGMKDYAFTLAEEELLAAGLSSNEVAELVFELAERAESELTIEHLPRGEAECLAVAPRELLDWLNEAWIPATAPNFGWVHGRSEESHAEGVFRFEDETAFDYRCADEDLFSVATERDPTATASRVLSVYVWENHQGHGSVSVDGRPIADLDFSYQEDLESSFAQLSVGVDNATAEKAAFNAVIDALGSGALMRIETGRGDIVEIPLQGAEPILACNRQAE